MGRVYSKAAHDIVANLTDSQDSFLYNDISWDREKEAFTVGELEPWLLDLGLATPDGQLTILGLDVTSIVKDYDLGSAKVGRWT